jgi:hypothetical protein
VFIEMVSLESERLIAVRITESNGYANRIGRVNSET